MRIMGVILWIVVGMSISLVFLENIVGIQKYIMIGIAVTSLLWGTYFIFATPQENGFISIIEISMFVVCISAFIILSGSLASEGKIQISSFKTIYSDEAVLEPINVTYDGLSDKEIRKYKESVVGLKEPYKYLAKELYVTKNSTYVDEYCQNGNVTHTTKGCNYGRGDRIVVNYYEDKKNNRNLLCHELMHSAFAIRNEENDDWDSVNPALVEESGFVEEDFVDSLKEACYK